MFFMLNKAKNLGSFFFALVIALSVLFSAFPVFALEDSVAIENDFNEKVFGKDNIEATWWGFDFARCWWNMPTGPCTKGIKCVQFSTGGCGYQCNAGVWQLSLACESGEVCALVGPSSMSCV